MYINSIHFEPPTIIKMSYRNHNPAIHKGFAYYYNQALSEDPSFPHRALDTAAKKHIRYIFSKYDAEPSSELLQHIANLMVGTYKGGEARGLRRSDLFTMMEETAQKESMRRIQRDEPRGRSRTPPSDNHCNYRTYTAAPAHGGSYQPTFTKRLHQEEQRMCGEENRCREHRTLQQSSQGRYRTEKREPEYSYREDEYHSYDYDHGHHDHKYGHEYEEEKSKSQRFPSPLPHSRSHKTASNSSTNLYTVLGVSRSASTEEIKKAYRQLSFKHHPDRASAGEKQRATDTMSTINTAYEVLKDERKREFYDSKGRVPDSQDGFSGTVEERTGDEDNDR